MLTQAQWTVLHDAKNNRNIVDPWKNMNTLGALLSRDIIAHRTIRGTLQMRVTPLGTTLVKEYTNLQNAPSFAVSRHLVAQQR